MWTKALVILLAAASVAMTPRHKLIRMEDDYRRDNGRPVLRVSDRLSAYMERLATRMSRDDKLRHSDGHCAVWGQNVGVGDSAWEVFRAFKRSDLHDANLLGTWTRWGVGAVRDERGLWVAMEFCR